MMRFEFINDLRISVSWYNILYLFSFFSRLKKRLIISGTSLFELIFGPLFLISLFRTGSCVITYVLFSRYLFSDLDIIINVIRWLLFYEKINVIINIK
jgi:hypothetical protein